MTEDQNPQQKSFTRTNSCELNTLEQIHLKAIEASPDAIIVTDFTGIIIIFNQRAEYIFGYGREEVLGKEIEILIPEKLRPTHTKERSNYVLDPYVRGIGEGRILQALHKTGVEFIVQVRLAPLIITGAGLYVMAVVTRVNMNLVARIVGNKGNITENQEK